MKKIVYIVLFVLLGFGGYYLWEHQDDLANATSFQSRENSVLTFELNNSPDTILQSQQRELLRTKEHTFGKCVVKFAPYLLMDVKYTTDAKRTEDAKALWNLTTGEMVLDTQNFESTRGFADCMHSQASQDDFRILHALSKRGGTTTKELLSAELGMNSEVLQDRLEVLRKKHLITTKLDEIRLHFQSPLLKVEPSTRITFPLVSKVISSDSKLPAKYSVNEIKKLSLNAFGNDFAIRSVHEVYVPIFAIEVQNPDGSILKTFWNGLTCKRIEQPLGL